MATLTLTLGASADDAAIHRAVAYSDTSTTILFGGVGNSGANTNYGEGYRFTNVTLGPTDYIASAVLNLMKSGNEFISVAVRLAAIAEDNTDTFSSGSAPGSRTIGSFIAVETPNASHTSGTVYAYPPTLANQRTLGAAIRETINRAGWASGNALGLANNSDQDASASETFSREITHSWDSDTSASEPQLVITYFSNTVTFGNVGTFAAGNNVSVTPTAPVGYLTGDWLVCLAYTRGAGTLSTATSGWSAVSGFPVQYTTTSTSGMNVFIKQAASGSETMPQVDISGGSAGDDVIAQVIYVMGCDGTTPVKQVGATSPNGSAANIGAISGITCEDKNAVLVMGGRRDDWTSVATLSGDSLTWTEISDLAISTGGTDAGMVWDFGQNTTGGQVTVTSKTFTVTGGSANPGGGIMLELQVTVVATGQPTMRRFGMVPYARDVLGMEGLQVA